MNDKKQKPYSLEEKSNKLKQLVARYQASFENSRDAMNIFSMDRRILDVNNSLLQLSGYTRKELLSMHLSDLYPQALSTNSEQRFKDLIQEEKLPLFETFLLTKDNKKIPVEIAVTFLEHWKDETRVCQGIIRDISQTKAVLAKLKKSEEKYRGLIENLDVGISRSTPGPDGRYIEVNQALVDLLGYSKKQLFKSNIFKFHKDSDKADSLFKEIRSKGGVRGKEIHLVHKKGPSVIVSYTGKAIKNAKGDILYIDDIIVDMTSKKTIEEEIQKNEKLKSIGALAGGIAHHFNNIMTGLFGNISLAKMELSAQNPAIPYLVNAEECMQEGIALTKQLLTFAKGGDPIKENIKISGILKDAALFSLSGSNIRLKFTFEKELWQIKADKSQISQVISNIVMNARQAMASGGELSIHIEKSDFLKDNLLTISKDQYLKIIISDNGSGMHQKDLERIFDPYFTTRKDGSGMGLSICYSIIKKHDGHIFVTSQVGTGTTITIYLPALTTQTVKETSMQISESETAFDGKHKILVMDDEEHIRILLKKMLEKFEYHVELAKDGEDAIQLYKALVEKNQTPDLVIMDLTIPGGMGGKEAAKKLLEFDPGAKIVVSSGYSTDPIMANFKAFGLKGIIPKPYRMEELKTSVKEILSQ
ncbi:MAG: PAS domain S-box protein [Desulfobacula sp.]|nr:PAS domain S-box protein [Desulfobacula sp.]